ncbi:MAG: hypothetical protein HY001_01440 [Candidatus Portnoybacteria bacterium]|nr:hypothetical protein [Candidatus Portnoybacteria bacterium]
MEYSLIVPAFIAGMLTFLAPCTLPMVPGYLAFISGTSLNEVSDPQRAGKARKRIFLNGLFYVVGFSLVFIVLGGVVGFAGSLIAPWRIWITRIGSILTLAAARTTALGGALLLSVFSLGLAVPFLAIAGAIGSSSRIVQKMSPYLNIVSFIGGLILVSLGILLATNNMALLVSYGYQLFNFINYDKLLDYL